MKFWKIVFILVEIISVALSLSQKSPIPTVTLNTKSSNPGQVVVTLNTVQICCDIRGGNLYFGSVITKETMYFQSSLHSRYIVVYLLSISYLFHVSNKILTILTVFTLTKLWCLDLFRAFDATPSIYKPWTFIHLCVPPVAYHQSGRIRVPTEIAFSSHHFSYKPTITNPPTYIPTKCDTMLRYDNKFIRSFSKPGNT